MKNKIGKSVLKQVPPIIREFKSYYGEPRKELIIKKPNIVYKLEDLDLTGKVYFLYMGETFIISDGTNVYFAERVDPRFLTKERRVYVDKMKVGTWNFKRTDYNKYRDFKRYAGIMVYDKHASRLRVTKEYVHRRKYNDPADDFNLDVPSKWLNAFLKLRTRRDYMGYSQIDKQTFEILRDFKFVLGNEGVKVFVKGVPPDTSNRDMRKLIKAFSKIGV